MSVYKDNATGKWRVIYRYTDITGKRKQTQKRGFETKREAVAWEHEMMLKSQAKLDMTFGSFYEIYEADKASRLKQSTWETKSHIIRTKILPYFADRKIDEIEVRDRKASTLTLQQVKEPILFFEEFNEMMERESARPVEAVGNVHDAVVVKDAEEIEETIGIEKNPTEDLEVQDISILESTVEEVAVMEPVIERPLTIGERAKEISTVIRNDYGRYDNVPVKVKAELFQFSVDDFEADMKLHSLMLKELNVRMYSSELYDDYMSIVDATDKKKLGELQKVDQYSKAKRWNQSR